MFAPFPIEMDEHPKIAPLSDAAFRALFEATFYSRRMLSDGFLDERIVLKRWGRQVADELSGNDPERPSWVRVEGAKPGWRIHDFEKHHPLRADVESKRSRVSADRSAAGKRGAAKRWQADSKRMANDSSETETETELTTPKGVVARKRKPEVSLPDDWQPKPAHVQYATDHGIDGRHEEQQFRNHAQANDRRQRDWDAAFRMWLGNAKPGGNGFAARAGGPRKPGPDARAAATMALADSLKEIEP